jgi:hypothetical protein
VATRQSWGVQSDSVIVWDNGTTPAAVEGGESLARHYPAWTVNCGWENVIVWNNTGTTEAVVVPETPAETGGGRGGVNPWPGRSERSWDKWWKREHAKRLEKKKRAAEKKVEKLQAKLKESRTDLTAARTIEAIQALLKELESIQTLLDKEQARLDDLELKEVAMLWRRHWNE